MTKKKIIFIELVFIGLIVAIINMYLCLAKVLYKIRDNTEQTLKDHRTMTCTIITLDNGNNAIVCYPQELDLSKDEIPHVNI